MSDLFVTVAQALHAVLPGCVRLPSLTFELPHLIYWPGLILFPLIAFWLVRREARAAGNDRVTLPILALPAFGLAICVLFPGIILWLPKLVYG